MGMRCSYEVQMEFDGITKLIFGIVSAIGTAAVVFLTLRQATKVKAELLEKFETALEKSQKHSVAELFRLIHGVRMSYSDIAELVKHDECIKIIYAIKKTPGMVSYKNKAFTYTGIGTSPIFRFIDRWFTKFGITFFVFISLVSLLMLVIGNGATAITGFLFLIVSVAMFVMQINEHRYNQMVSNLISPEDSNPIEPTVNVPAGSGAF
jgi:predicted PurR-regulated permease PerM